MSLLSIIIPIYNIEKFLENCLNSLVAQKLEDGLIEVILVNDGSQDNSLNICKRYSIKFPFIKVINLPHRGIGAARNAGLNIANGKYIYFLDGDDYLAHHTLKHVLPFLNEERYDLVSFRSKRTRVLTDHTSDTPHFKPVPGEEKNGIWQMAHNQEYRIEVWWYMIKKSFLEESGYIFEHNRFVNDSYYTPNLFLNAPSVLFLPLDIHRYVFRKGSITKNKDPEHLYKHMNDMLFAIARMNEILKEHQESKKPYIREALQKVNSQKFKYSFFVLLRLIRSQGSNSDLEEVLIKLKRLDAYPIKTEFLKGKVKISAALFNLKPTLQLLLKTNSSNTFRSILKYY